MTGVTGCQSTRITQCIIMCVSHETMILLSGSDTFQHIQQWWSSFNGTSSELLILYLIQRNSWLVRISKLVPPKKICWTFFTAPSPQKKHIPQTFSQQTLHRSQDSGIWLVFPLWTSSLHILLRQINGSNWSLSLALKGWVFDCPGFWLIVQKQTNPGYVFKLKHAAGNLWRGLRAGERIAYKDKWSLFSLLG